MAQLTPGGYDIKSLTMNGFAYGPNFRLGPMMTDKSDPKYRKGTYKIGHVDEGKTIANRNYIEEPVYVKKVSFF